MMKTYRIAVLFLVVLGSFVATGPLAGQTVSNVRVEQHDKKVIIRYHLQGTEKCKVEIFLSEDGGRTFSSEPLQSVSGDVGTVAPGQNKKATWNVLRDRQILYGSNFVFRVSADELSYEQFTLKGVDFEFLPVPGGTFEMGSTDREAEDDEQPVHTVTVSDFYMGKYEVTQAQWRAVMGNNPSYFDGCDDCPVEQVSWNDVQKFIQKLNEQTGKTFRLPTEAEWEYAARGGESYKYAGSNNIGSVAWYRENSYDLGSSHENYGTNPVGSKQPNGYGLYDMTGNVWEWCSDWYDSDYYGNSPQNNPQGPSSGSNRVYRGGSWGGNARYCRVADRNGDSPDDGNRDLGFRLVFVP